MDSAAPTGGRTGAPALKERLARYLEDRQYRPLWHLLAVLFIIGAASVLFYKNYPPHGTLMYTDMTWPNTLSRLAFNASHTWMPYGSYPLGGSQLWFYWIYPTASMIGILVTRLLFKKATPLDETGKEEHMGRKKISLLNHRAWGLVAAVMVAILVIVSLAPVTLWFARIIFSPADVPRDYRQVNDWLARQPDGDRVAWMPFFPLDSYVYRWAPEKKIGPYSVLSSPPSLSSIQMVTDEGSYYNWLESLYLKGVSSLWRF
ncbi:MAG TPA: hypothetical protein VIK02_03195 [Candidatus Anoxymicrobiaceae bacterium]